MSMEDKRFRRRTWNRTKSHLPKYTSQPELQLLPQGRPRFQCQQCGFVNTLIPLCLWCTWTSPEAEHEFDATTPRARRASAPARVFTLQIEENRDTTDPHDHQRRLVVSRSMSCSRKPDFTGFPVPAGIREEEEMRSASKQPLSNGGQEGDADPHLSAIASSEPVATATHSWSSLVFARTQITSQAGDGPFEPNLRPRTSRIELRDSIPHFLPSEEQPTPSVDRPSIMPAMRSSRSNLRVKRSHQLLLIDIHDTKMLSSTSGDDDALILNDSFNQDRTKPSSPINAQQQRTIRRRKHLNIMQTSVPDASAAEPIAISLNIHTPSTELDFKSPEPTHRLSRSLSHPQSATSESSGDDPTTPPLTPTLIPMPSTTDSSGLATHAPGSSPVRLGHPSRPYYSAIRKNGISPPPSRPSSVSGPSPSSSPRPQSYTHPSSFPTTSATNTTTASRHLSMSAMFVSPPYSSPPGVFSAFSVMDDADNEDEDDDDMPVLPPTPAPGRTRFSLSSSDRRRFSHGPVLSTPTGATPKHTHSQSLSQARSKGLRGSVGFSMSGETELRMALAVGAADSGVAESGFRFRETVVPPTSVDTETHIRARNGFMDRVRKLRQGLKDLLFTTSTTSTTTTTA